MKRLLVLTSRLPYPPMGGDKLRIYEICKHLSAEFELSLLSMCESEEEMNYSVPSDGIFSHVERVFHGKAQRFIGSVRVLPSSTPLQIGYFQNVEFQGKLRDLLPRHDGILAHLIRAGSYLRSCELPKFLEMTDALHLTYSRATRAYASNPARWLLYRTEAARLLRYEMEIIRRFDLSILVSEVDRDALLQGSQNSRVMVCPNGVDTGAFPFNYAPDGKTILFIGNNTARHNADAILYFAQTVMPLVRSRMESAEFRIIGPVPDKLRIRLQRIPGVVVTGSVSNVAVAAKHASVGVCPIRFGAGVQNKILEYMSLGIPTVTSSIGLEGLSAIPEVHLSLADNPQEWSDRVCVLLRDSSLGFRFAKASRKLVEEEYSWASMLAPLSRAIRNRLVLGSKGN